MPRSARFIGAATLGLALGTGVIAIVERGLARLPEGPGGVIGDPAAFAGSVREVPTEAAVTVLAGWAAAVFVASWSASRLVEVRGALLAVIVGLVTVTATVLRLLVQPHPFWFSVTALVLVLAAAAAARALALRRDRRRPGTA